MTAETIAKIDSETEACHPRARTFRRRRWAMTATRLLLVAGLVSQTGCQQLKEHFTRVRPNNPVVGPAPPRLSLEEASADSLGYASLTSGEPVSADITMVSLTEDSEPVLLTESQVVAVVNGNSIMAGDVFAPYARQLAKMKTQLPPEQYSMAQKELLKRDLAGHIERTLLSHALKSTLKQEQVEKLDQILDEAFADHVRTLLKENGITSAAELDQKLQAEGTSLSDIRQSFGVQQLAMQYLSTESQVNVQLGRVDLLAYYNKNLDKFSHPTRVKWQEIRVSINPKQDRKIAVEKLNQIVQELQEGASFEETARKHSDGPTASQGGQWDWTKEGSLSDTQLNETLFSLKKGEISKILSSPQHFRIIRVVDREESSVTPFEDLQVQLRKEILSESRAEKTASVLKKLQETATIQTIFDNDPKLAAEMRDIGQIQKKRSM